MSTSTGEVRDYIGPFQYLNSAPFEVTHEEGRVLPGSTNGYEYFLRDHLGNVRAIVANVNGAFVTQMVDYDPWGLELSGLGSGLSSNRAKFNGKETLAELGSGLLDFGARGYDATIGRWGVVDPLAEVSRRFSPFVYGNDNPVRMIDPDGMETQEYQRSNRDDFGNVTFNGAALPGEGGYISGGTGPGKGKNDKTSSTATVSVDKQNDANFKEQTKDLGSDLADNLITIGKFLLGIPEQSDPNIQIAAVPMPFFMGGGASKAAGLTDDAIKAGFSLTKHGELTNGTYIVAREAMKKHVFVGVSDRSIFYPTLNAQEAVLKAAQYADQNNLWIGIKAKVPVTNTNIGILTNGEHTNVINVYRNSNGFIHGSPGTKR
ncbi:RHS repeat domain-containing protein [Spirosoma litoris]